MGPSTQAKLDLPEKSGWARAAVEPRLLGSCAQARLRRDSQLLARLQEATNTSSSALISNSVFNRNFKVHYGMWIN